MITLSVIIKLMKALLINIIFSWLFLIFITNQANTSTLYLNQKPHNLNILKINSTEYVEINFISRILFPSYAIKNNSILYKNLEIKFANSSFFISIKQNDEIRVHQMKLPVIYFKNFHYVPLEAFLNVLSNNKIIKFDKTRAGYFVEYFYLNTKLENNFNLENSIERKRLDINLEKKYNKPTNFENKNPKPKENELILEPAYKQKNKENKYYIPEEIKNSIKK